MELTPGSAIDHDHILRRIEAIGKDYDLRDIGVDPWNARGHVMNTLDSAGFRVTEFRQGFASMSVPTKELEILVRSEKVSHGDNEVLRWMASNVAVEEDAAGNVKPSKKKSTEKIDGIVALIMAIGLSGLEVEAKSVYEERGFLTL